MNIYWKSVLWVLFAGCFWATGPLFVKFSVDASYWIVKYLWVRMFCLIVLYSVFISARIKNDKLSPILTLSGMSRKWVVAGVLGLACAMSGFVLSLSLVPAANTLCELAAAPFFAAVLERIFLNTRINVLTGACMFVATTGVILFALEGVITGNSDHLNATTENITTESFQLGGGSSGSIDSSTYNPALGNTLGITASIGMALYTVSLRTIPKTSSEKNRSLYGLVMSMYGTLVVIVGTSISLVITTFGAFDQSGKEDRNQNYHPMNPFGQPAVNIYLSIGHAVFIFAGFVFYTLGSNHLPAPETVLLSMTEVVGGVLLTYIFIGEYPGTLGIIGIALTTWAVLVNGVGNGIKEQKRSGSTNEVTPKKEKSNQIECKNEEKDVVKIVI
jgi:drug/metabolite transporter (DMT)-like permease